MKPRVLQLFAAGVNCDRELRFAFESAGAVVTEMHIRVLMQNPAALRDFDVFAIPGGFTYGDDLGAGRILALEVEKFLGGELADFHERGGTVFGPCNGFQIMVKAGLLPALPDMKVSLTWNDTHHFECRWTRLKVEPAIAHILPAGSVLPAPSAHAEGKLVLGVPEVDLRRLEAEGCVAFRYCDAQGQVTQAFPDCPNGSIGAIAGLVSQSGRILGLMPHPERNLSRLHLPDRGAGAWGDGSEGLQFFRGLLDRYLG
ncbi:MAG: phosphoribosylformylglycinamidine synthase [Planctomycetes bacterium]|jgi:phosphoribosylformylglycinamidine synthase|nr:phosphoribosylformylglycinamidine synthase [Planctomycetota bacterium]MBT4028545.1 phosphoribosylformylglycinamidine synthase [Planctomycetota bacterium]MBT4559437.1 phosphoribosylformylglycinamidine synthase [Planctomycetota bacterium]MBT7013125.1 phosphoribosylformylglycinamidine synthase [Planctomycetota bacterium]MBT7319036.1 phosphoribosylformylglycinamidine synthase [Planctomycetota bacterium]